MIPNNQFFFNNKQSSIEDGYYIILGGQSNATDRYNVIGNLSSGLIGAQDDAFTYFKSVDNSSDNGAFQNINTGVNTQAGTP